MYQGIERVALMISDPWEFGTKCGVGPFYGRIVDSQVEKISHVDVEAALVELESPINYLDAVHTSAICHLRHEATSFGDVQTGRAVSVNLTLLPVKAKRLSEISASDFGLGFAATGSLELVLDSSQSVQEVIG